MLDFDTLVLAPLMGVFGQPVLIVPTASQPGAAPYPARGVLKIENVDMTLEEGIASVQVITLGVRAADFAVFVQPGDRVVVNGRFTLGNVVFDQITALIDDTDEDGQGGSILTLKKTAP